MLVGMIVEFVKIMVIAAIVAIAVAVVLGPVANTLNQVGIDRFHDLVEQK